MNDKWNLDGNKLLWHMDRVHKHFVRGKRIVPITIDMGITKFCNVRCEFCYGIFQGITGEMIPAKPLIQLFKDAPKVGVKAIAIVGDGEPTLNPALCDAVKAGADGGLDMAIATNGVRLDIRMLEILLQRLVWFRFNLSAVEEGYEIVHGRKYWERVKENILMATYIKKNARLPVTIGLQMVLTRNALKYVIREAQFAIDAGVDYFVIKQYSDPKCDGMTGISAEEQNSPEVQKILKDAMAMSTKKTAIIAKIKAMEYGIKRPYDHCYDVPLYFQISGNGKAYPCGYLFGDDRYCYGDITKQSFGEIINSERYWQVVKVLQTTFNVHKDCVGCCRHDSTNLFIHKFLHKPDHINFI
jgi:Radical SAM superfamily.